MSTSVKLARPSFKRRVTWTLVGFATATALIVGALGTWINESIEQSIWQAALTAQLTYYRDTNRLNARATRASPAGLTTYVAPRGMPWPEHAPAALKNLNPGIHDEYTLNGRPACVLVKDVGAKRIYLVYDIARLERREIYKGLGGITIIGALVVGVFFTGAWIARRLVAPVEKLAARIQALEPSARGERIGRSYRDNEMTTIASAFDRYLERLDGFVVREQEFTSIASHELRTPVTIISGALDILQNLPNMPSQARRPLERARRATVNMRQTVSTLLDLAREGASEPSNPTTFRLDDLILEVVEDHRYLLEGKDLELRIIQLEPTKMTATIRLVYIAVANLVRNAMQHTAEGTVAVTFKDKVLTIENTVPRAAESIRQSSSDLARGHGLGLYIIQRLCSQFGWKFVLRELASGGTCAGLDFSQSNSAMAMTPPASQGAQTLVR